VQADALDAAPPSPATKQHLDLGVMAWRSVFCPHPERCAECAVPTVLAVSGATRDLAKAETGNR